MRKQVQLYPCIIMIISHFRNPTKNHTFPFKTLNITSRRYNFILNENTRLEMYIKIQFDKNVKILWKT